MTRNFLILMLFACALASCSRKADDQMDLKPSAVTVAAAAPEPVKKAEPDKYVYPFSAQNRDPFVPLIGGQGTASASDSAQLLAQNFSNLELKGIIGDGKGRMALIVSSDGDSYVLKSGRVFDKRNHAINGISGAIRENSIVLISANKTVRELALTRKGASVNNPK